MLVNQPANNGSQPRAIRMVSVYRHGQPRTSMPAFKITRNEARWWLQNGAAVLGEACGNMRDRGTVLELSRPTSDRLQLCSSLGTRLTFGNLRGDEEVIAAVNSFKPASRLAS